MTRAHGRVPANRRHDHHVSDTSMFCNEACCDAFKEYLDAELVTPRVKEEEADRREALERFYRFHTLVPREVFALGAKGSTRRRACRLECGRRRRLRLVQWT
jgi:hypothetical protein